MLQCNKCGGKCEEKSLYCVHCGERLDTKACRRCGDYLLQEAKFCARCGYPTTGAVCSKCGKVNPDEANFCLSCGSRLGTYVKRDIHSDSAPGAAMASEPKVKREGVGKFAYNVSRSFMLPALMLCLFILSFFGMFRMRVPLVDVEAEVTGFDALRGIFLLMDPPTEAELTEAYEDFSDEYLDKHDISLRDLKNPEKVLGDIITEFGTLRLCIYEDNIHADMVLQVVMWGLMSLALMVSTLVFFILSLIHAIKLTMNKKDSLYRHESLSLALTCVLAFAFLLVGKSLAGASIAMVVLTAAALSAITVLGYVVEKKPRPTLVTNLRRGICAALAVVTVCLATQGLMTVEYSGKSGSGIGTTASESSSAGKSITAYYDSTDLYSGMYDCMDDVKDTVGELDLGEYDFTSASGLDNLVKLCLSQSSSVLSRSEKADILQIFGNPAVLSRTSEADDLCAVGSAAGAWLLFVFNLLTAVAFSLLLYNMLMEEATDVARKTLLWHILTLVGVVGIIGGTVPFVVIGNGVTTALKLGFKYSISALPIIAAVFAVAALVVEIVLRKNGTKSNDA